MLNALSVLIVDDEPLIRDILRDGFVLHGAKVTEAPNGKVALDLAKLHRFDAIITDIRMPGGDGLTLIKNLNSIPTPRPKLFVCTAYSDLEDEAAERLGLSFVFNKPFDREDLILTVEQACGRN